MVLLLAYLQSFEMFFEMNNLSQKVQVVELYNKQIRLSKTNTINKIDYAYKKLFAFKFHATFFMQRPGKFDSSIWAGTDLWDL